jgi:hypothetical protein
VLGTLAGKIIEVGSAGNILFGTASATGLTQNASYISGWKYQATGAATYYEQYAGSHIWNNAPSWDGTGDNTIAFNQAMTLTADGRLGIGTPSPANMLDVRGTNPIIRVEPHVSTDAASFQAINDSKISYFGRENSLGSYFFSTNVTPYSTVLNAYGSTAPIIFGHNTPEVYILNGGNVGIGTSSPTSISGYTALEVNGNSSGSIIDLAQGDVMRGRLVAVTGSFALETSGSIPILFSPGGTERARITSDGIFKFNSGYGSVADAYGCRVWANVYGGRDYSTGINASGNGSSFVRNSSGDYSFNFATAMVDINYSAVCAQESGSITLDCVLVPYNYLTTYLQVISSNSGSQSDFRLGSIAIFR